MRTPLRPVRPPRRRKKITQVTPIHTFHKEKRSKKEIKGLRRLIEGSAEEHLQLRCNEITSQPPVGSICAPIRVHFSRRLPTGFVQQLAVSYVQHGHHFYVAGSIPERKDPAAVDEKLIRRYGLNVSKWTRARQRESGRASVQYIRCGRFFVLVATRGRHAFFEREAAKDIRRYPIRFAGYSIGYKRGVDRRWHVSVRIAPDEYLRLKSYLVSLAAHRSVENLAAEFQRIPFEPYAPVRRQLLNILRAVNKARALAGYEPVPIGTLRLTRRIVLPFELQAGLP